jgi:methionyl-tRNA formyltransferase
LAALLDAGHEIALVLTQPDRPAGRGMRPAASAVKKLALERGLEIAQPPTLKSDDALAKLRASNADAMIVAAYGLLLPPAALTAARLGALNIHASLLPRWRGAAPIQRALLAGDDETGITIMQMDAGLDTGPMLSQSRLAIAANDDAGALHDKLAALGAQAVVEALAGIEAGRLRAIPQPQTGVTYASKILQEDTIVDWRQSAQEIGRRLRALSPVPGARSSWRGEMLKLWRGERIQRSGAPGLVLEAGAEGIVVGCGTDALRLVELQRAGGKRLPAAEFLRGSPIASGEQLGAPR